MNDVLWEELEVTYILCSQRWVICGRIFRWITSRGCSKMCVTWVELSIVTCGWSYKWHMGGARYECHVLGARSELSCWLTSSPKEWQLVGTAIGGQHSCSVPSNEDKSMFTSIILFSCIVCHYSACQINYTDTNLFLVCWVLTVHHCLVFLWYLEQWAVI
jgi:hypothetical protein